jgi:Na+/H+ antiporter NhaC
MITGWFALIIATLGVVAAIGVPVTVGLGVSVILAGILPAVVLVAVFQGAPPRSVGQVLYDVDHETRGGVPLGARAGAPRQQADRSGPPTGRS